MNEQKDNKEIPWWRDGVILFVKVSSYIAIPIITASYIGNYLDKKYKTGSLIFFCLLGLAFISTIYLIWKETKKYKNN